MCLVNQSSPYKIVSWGVFVYGIGISGGVYIILFFYVLMDFFLFYNKIKQTIMIFLYIMFFVKFLFTILTKLIKNDTYYL